MDGRVASTLESRLDGRVAATSRSHCVIYILTSKRFETIEVIKKTFETCRLLLRTLLWCETRLRTTCRVSDSQLINVDAINSSTFFGADMVIPIGRYRRYGLFEFSCDRCGRGRYGLWPIWYRSVFQSKTMLSWLFYLILPATRKTKCP